MRSFTFLIPILMPLVSFGQKLERVYLDPKDSTANMYIAVVPENKPVKAFMFLLDGFNASPDEALQETTLPVHAAEQGILTIIPILKTGACILEQIMHRSNH